MKPGNFRVLFLLICQVLIVPFLFSPPVHADTKLLTWDGGSGHTWPGWTWRTDASGWGEKGWQKDSGESISGTWYPRSHEKTDYGNRSDADIGTSLPPYKSSGNTLKIYNTSGTKYAAWWWIYDDNYGAYGYADNTTNRLEFYAYYQNLNEFVNVSNSTIEDWSLHFATYLCWPGGGLGGDGCPTEADGQHYYHHITAHNGAWIKTQINRHPDHKRDSIPVINPTDNPASPKDYFQYMNTFYFETTATTSAPSYWLDDMVFRTETQAENEISISNLWIGYWSSTDKWEIGWADPSFGGSYGDSSVSTFEIRYSTSPITNVNFSSATIIEPDYFEYGTTNRVRRPNPWVIQGWTRFSIPNSVESENNLIYFAIKDVSSTANGDGHNAPSGNIRTINYNLRPGGAPPPPPPPPLAVSTTTLPQGVVGSGYSVTLQATGGSLPYTWSITSGPLPAGLSLNGATGVISGSPSTAGTYTFTIKVTDGASASATQGLTVDIFNRIPMAPSNLTIN